MLAMSRALMARPKLLLLDEPSLGLAPLYIKKIFQTLRELNQDHGVTILLIEQNAHHALRVAHRGYVLQHGQIVMTGSGRDLLASAEVRAATGITVFSGMLGVTIFGLFLTPVFYVTLRKLSGTQLHPHTEAVQQPPHPQEPIHG